MEVVELESNPCYTAVNAEANSVYEPMIGEDNHLSLIWMCRCVLSVNNYELIEPSMNENAQY